MTRFGDFWKFKVKKKISKAVWLIWGNFGKHHFLRKIILVYFLGNFWGKLGYFLVQHLVTLPARSNLLIRLRRSSTVPATAAQLEPRNCKDRIFANHLSSFAKLNIVNLLLWEEAIVSERSWARIPAVLDTTELDYFCNFVFRKFRIVYKRQKESAGDQIKQR